MNHYTSAIERVLLGLKAFCGQQNMRVAGTCFAGGDASLAAPRKITPWVRMNKCYAASWVARQQLKSHKHYLCVVTLAALLLAPAAIAKNLAQGNQRAASFVPWTFQTNFRNGIPGWLSYPLAQDEGFDPSLYTTNEGAPALVRDVVARGQKILRVGLVRPLRFHATPSSTLELSYALDLGGPLKRARIILAGANAKKYFISMPTGSTDWGNHIIRVSGSQFGLPDAGVTIEAIVVEAEVDSPILGSRNRLTLRSLTIEAERPARLALEAPQIVSSQVSGVAVAPQIVTPGARIEVRLAPGPAGRVELYNGSGKLSVKKQISEKHTGGWQVNIVPSAAGFSPGLWSAKICRGAAERDFRFLVLRKTPPHPRILLTSTRLAQLRSQLALVQLVHQQAAQLEASLAYNPDAGANIALLSPVSVFPGLPQYFQLMEDYSRAVAYNALDFRLTGDEHALASARKALETVADWPTWTPPWFSAHGLHTYYEVGVFTQRVALGYDLISSRLDPAERSRIAGAFWRNSIQPTLDDYFFNDRLPTATSNHMANSVGGSIAACVALYGDAPGWNERLGTALAELITSYESLLKGLFPGDGSEAEPAGYEDFAMEGLSYGAAALQALGIRPPGTDRMLQGFWWLRYAQFTPELFLDTGDFGGGLSSLSGFAWGAENGNDLALRAFYGAAPARTLAGVTPLPTISHTGRKLEDSPGLLDLVCCTRAAAPVLNPPTARIFPLRGSAVMRSGWNQGSTVISLRVGPWFNHEHHDEGSFQIAAWGEELISEAGYADYYKDPRYADYFSQSPGHNTVLLDGDAFSQEDYDGRTWQALNRFPKFRDHVFSQNIDYIAADLAPAYNDGAGLERYSREYVFIKPDLLVIHDHLESRTPHRYTFLLHPPPGDQARIDNPVAIIRGKAAFASITAGGPNQKWTVERAPVPETAYANLDRDPVLPRETLRLDSPSETSTDFGAAIRLQKLPQIPPSLATFKLSSGFGYRSSGGQTTVLFRTSPGMLESHSTVFGSVSSDGNVAAITRRAGLINVLAVRASELRLAGRLVLAVKPHGSKVDIAIRQSSNGEEIHLECAGGVDLEAGVNRQPVAVTVDGASIPLLLSHGFVSIPRLAKGDHVIQIRY